MRYCTKCGNGNQESHTFCNKCGNKIDSPNSRIDRNSESKTMTSPKFKKIYVFYIIISIALFLTNPTEEQHEFAVNLKVSKVLRENYDNGSIWSSLGLIIGEGFANEYIKNRVSRQNLLLFSLSSIDGSICGIGFLDNVYLSPEVSRLIKSKISENLNQLKNSGIDLNTSDPKNNSGGSTNSKRGILNDPDALPDN
jgi:hypothetical protein